MDPPGKCVPLEANYGLALPQYAAQPNQGYRTTDSPPEGRPLAAQIPSLEEGHEPPHPTTRGRTLPRPTPRGSSASPDPEGMD
jgi:hypothetical protein